MKAQFIVTVEGDWLHNGRKVTAHIAEKYVREAVKEQFAFLADRVSVKRLSIQKTKKEANNGE